MCHRDSYICKKYFLYIGEISSVKRIVFIFNVIHLRHKKTYARSHFYYSF